MRLLHPDRAVTGVEDDAVAIQMLEAANYSLEDAVNLFFAADGHLPGAGAGGARGGNAGEGSVCWTSTNELHARQRPQHGLCMAGH
jgi:hypothetical protein